MKNLIVSLSIFFFLFSCAPTKKIERPLGTLTLEMYQYIQDTTFTCSDNNIIEFERGLQVITIPPKTQCAAMVDTTQSGQIIGRVYFGKDPDMSISGDPFLTYCVDMESETKEFYLCTWPNHPDSIAFDSKKSSGTPKFWKLNKGEGSKILFDSARVNYYLPGVRKTGSGRSPKT